MDFGQKFRRKILLSNFCLGTILDRLVHLAHQDSGSQIRDLYFLRGFRDFGKFFDFFQNFGRKFWVGKTLEISAGNKF